MQTRKDILSLRCSLSLLLLLGLELPPAIAQTPSYKEAVLRAVDGFNQQSSDTNLYRLLDLQSLPAEDEDPSTAKYVRFRVKETECDKASQQLPEQCNFKDQGLVKQCTGTVTLDQATDAFDINCSENGAQPQKFFKKIAKKVAKKAAKLGGLLQKGGQKIGEKLKKIGQKIKDLFQKGQPETEN